MINSRKYGYEEILNEPESQKIYSEQDEIFVVGFKKSRLKYAVFFTLNVLLFGTPFLLLYWYPQLTYFKYAKTSLKKAEKLLIKDSNDTYFFLPIQKSRISLEDTSTEFQKSVLDFIKINDELRFFIHKDIRYIWSDEQMQFNSLRGWHGEVKSFKEFFDNSLGYTAREQQILLKIYGENKIKVSIPNSWQVLIKEILQPFYIFQILSIILWFYNNYISYAICVVILSSWSILVTMYTTKKQKKSLQNLAIKTSPCNIFIIRRNGSVEDIDPSLLVPGDIIQIPKHGCIMACDALLLQGNCIVNESTLTGESCPVTKTPPTNTTEMFNSIISKRHVLFCGTEVLQTRYYGEGMVTAVTINTGFSTMKGELIRCILHPKPLGFKFFEDSVKFVLCLFIVAIFGICYISYISLRRNTDFTTLILDSLDLITIIVPPALPAALSMGVAYSQSRLSSKGIFCISPPKINMFGKLKLMCFDKTGTLTEEGLNLLGVVPCVNKQFGKLIEHPKVLHPKHPLVLALATCHSLTKIEGKLSGDPLDMCMFNSLNWELTEPGTDTCRYDMLCPTIVQPKNYSNVNNGFYKSEIEYTIKDHCRIDINESGFYNFNLSDEITENFNFQGTEERQIIGVEQLPYEVGLVREFPFTSNSRCMSVITRELGANHMTLYCKGAPEKVGELCLPDSLPKNFNSIVQVYASMGFRVLGLAYKKFDHKFTWRKSQRVKREEVEKDLNFLGLIILRNKLKQVSATVMSELRKANIRSVMITGDHLMTALSVSRESLIVLPEDKILEVKVISDENNPTISFQSFEPFDHFEDQNNIEFKGYSSDLPFTRQKTHCHYALDGKTWELLRTHFSDLVPKIIVKGTIFARMLPEQKTQLIQAFQDLDYIVGMCGDGANDYGAMKAAHVGVSLSETENSVAAPFTSKVQDVSCIVKLVQEGRCALVSTFVIFKYMTIYSLIQFISVLIVYRIGVCFGNIEFLYVDLVVTSLLAVVIGRTGPSEVLVKTRPIARLISFTNLFPLTLQAIVIFSIQIFALKFLYKQEWFVPVEIGPEAITVCWENTVVYCISLFQYLILALVYSKGKPYRQPFYKNFFFMVVFVFMSAFTVLLCVHPFRTLSEYFELIPLEDDTPSQTAFRIKLLILPFMNLVFSFLIKSLTGDRKWLKKGIHWITRKKQSKSRYKLLLSDSDLF